MNKIIKVNWFLVILGKTKINTSVLKVKKNLSRDFTYQYTYQTRDLCYDHVSSRYYKVDSKYIKDSFQKRAFI